MANRASSSQCTVAECECQPATIAVYLCYPTLMHYKKALFVASIKKPTLDMAWVIVLGGRDRLSFDRMTTFGRGFISTDLGGDEHPDESELSECEASQLDEY